MATCYAVKGCAVGQSLLQHMVPKVLWPRIRCQSRARMDRAGWGEDGIHRTRQSMGEWLYRVVQRKASRRTPRWLNLLYAEGSENRHRKLATPLQHRQTAWVTGLQATGTGGICACIRRAGDDATRASDAAGAGAQTVNALTFQPDHSVGADHSLKSGSNLFRMICWRAK